MSKLAVSASPGHTRLRELGFAAYRRGPACPETPNVPEGLVFRLTPRAASLGLKEEKQLAGEGLGETRPRLHRSRACQLISTLTRLSRGATGG
jgi:hypothetical protein